MKRQRNAIDSIIYKILSTLTILSLITIVGISGFIFCAFYTLDTKQDHIFLIKKNSGIKEISQDLSDQQIINRKITFYCFAKLYCKIYNKQILAGEYSLKGGSGIMDIMEIITAGKVIQHQIIIPEGFTVKQILERIKQLDNFTHFPHSITIKEGSMLPETYFYTYGTFDLDFIKRTQKMMQDFLAIEWPKRDKRIDKIISSPEEAIILASIIEKETYIDREKPLIAGVYLNRLQKNMRLQACPTVIYGLNLVESQQWNGKVLYSHLKSDSEYNTYMYKGLPPTAICNPGKAAILAVLHPQWTEKLFFVANGNGKHVFASDFHQHKRNIKLAKR